MRLLLADRQGLPPRIEYVPPFRFDFNGVPVLPAGELGEFPGLDELELDYENAALSYAIQKLAIEKNVTQSFYNVYDYQMSLQIAEEEYRNQQTSYEIIRNKVEGGLSSSLAHQCSRATTNFWV